MNRRAISLVEMLCVIAIICSLAALTFPVFARSKDSAKKIVCVSNLRQLYTAIELYRQNNDTSIPGSAPQLGYPDIHTAMGMGKQLLGNHPCDFAPWGPIMRPYPYIYYGRDDLFMGNPGDVQFGEYYSKVGEAGILLADLNHNPKDIAWESPFVTLKALTVNIGGSYRVYSSKGNFFFVPGPFWEDYAK